MKNGAPIVGLNDSGGARIQEGVVSLGGYADIFLRNTLASGVVPQISAIMGPCAGGAVYSPAITDFILMVKKTSYMFVTGPDVIRTVTHEEVTKEKLGGADTHNQISGVAHFAADSDEDCLATIRELLSYMPSNNMEDPPRVATTDDVNRVDAQLDTFIPESPNQPYEIRDLIRTIADEGHFLEVHQHFARNLVVGFIRLNGHSVGVVANQPAFLAGVLDINASRKGRALRPLLRRLQHPAARARRRSGISAGHRSGVRRHHHSRREAALRAGRGDRAEDHGDHAQGVRRRVLRDELEAHPRGHELRLPDRGDRGDGRGGGGQHSLQGRRRTATRRSPSTKRSSPTPTSPRSAATSTRSSSRASRAGS